MSNPLAATSEATSRPLGSEVKLERLERRGRRRKVERKKIQEEERREKKKRKVGRKEGKRGRGRGREEQERLFGINLTTLCYSCGYVKYRSKFLSRCFCCMWAWRGCGCRLSISSRVLT